MKLFISWTGATGKALATAVREWIPFVLQNVKPYCSAADIEKGSGWYSELTTALQESKFGIVCVTPDSQFSEWVLFEAGALFNSVQGARVSPLLFGLQSTDISGPLAAFQTTEFVEDQMHQLVESINSHAGTDAIDSRMLEKAFHKWWPDLEEQVARIMLRSGDIAPQVARSERELLEEVLSLTRDIRRRRIGASLPSYSYHFRGANPLLLVALVRPLIDLRAQVLHGYPTDTIDKNFVSICNVLQDLVNEIQPIDGDVGEGASLIDEVQPALDALFMMKMGEFSYSYKAGRTSSPESNSQGNVGST
jgi:hypothetical protein